MIDDPVPPSRARKQRRAVARGRRAIAAFRRGQGSMPRGIQVGVMALTLFLTVAGAFNATHLHEERRAARFERDSNRLARLLEQRLHRYEDAMHAGIAALDAASGDMDSDDWRRFAEGLHLKERYPGVNSIGFVQRVDAGELAAFERREAQRSSGFRVHPAVDQPFHLPIRFIEPLSPNREALGLDLMFEASRREAALDALQHQRPRMTAPIQLVQSDGTAPGFLFFAPYTGPSVSGLVYSPFVAADLLIGSLSDSHRLIDIALFDGGQALLDERGPTDPARADAVLQRTVELDAYGRLWRVRFTAQDAFLEATDSSEPELVLIGGLAINVMLIFLFVSFARVDRALRTSAGLSRTLDERSRALESTNRELERFACVASHDLKTPLRGIADLTWYLREDLQDVLESPTGHPDVAQHLDRLDRQTQRMEALIDGILEYSGIGRQNDAIGDVDVRAALDDLLQTLGVPRETLRWDTDGDVVRTHETPFLQVLNNLVNNAYKYHPDPANACVTVTLRHEPGAVVLTVEDDGPGIDPRFHARIFEMFETLQPKDVVESTGVGLAIVKKLTESRGGAIDVSSTIGSGSRFTVRWPLDLAAAPVATDSLPLQDAA